MGYDMVLAVRGVAFFLFSSIMASFYIYYGLFYDIYRTIGFGFVGQRGEGLQRFAEGG